VSEVRGGWGRSVIAGDHARCCSRMGGGWDFWGSGLYSTEDLVSISVCCSLSGALECF